MEEFFGILVGGYHDGTGGHDLGQARHQTREQTTHALFAVDVLQHLHCRARVLATLCWKNVQYGSFLLLFYTRPVNAFHLYSVCQLMLNVNQCFCSIILPY